MPPGVVGVAEFEKPKSYPYVKDTSQLRNNGEMKWEKRCSILRGENEGRKVPTSFIKIGQERL
jgi:hypothetical protein